MDFSELKGKTLKDINNVDNEELYFHTVDDEVYCLCHLQDCCEQVIIEDICGDLDDLVNSPILLAEEISSENEEPIPECYDESYTWTFYKLATNKGGVTIRWLCTSNGWYSEEVSFFKMTKKEYMLKIRQKIEDEVKYNKRDINNFNKNLEVEENLLRLAKKEKNESRIIEHKRNIQNLKEAIISLEGEIKGKEMIINLYRSN